MKKNFNLLSLICFVLIIAVTATVYCLLVENIFDFPVKWLSLAFVLIAELALFLKSVRPRKSLIMLVQDISGGVYLLVTLILSLIYINLSNVNLKGFISVHLIILLILLIIDISVRMAASSDYILAKSQNTMSHCQTVIDLAISENTNSELNKELKGISEAIRYSDNSVLVGNERELLKKLEELKDDLTDISSEDDIRTKINEINVLIKSRNVYLKQNRRGNF